jgi:hypothetical protein
VLVLWITTLVMPVLAAWAPDAATIAQVPSRLAMLSRNNLRLVDKGAGLCAAITGRPAFFRQFIVFLPSLSVSFARKRTSRLAFFVRKQTRRAYAQARDENQFLV